MRTPKEKEAYADRLDRPTEEDRISVYQELNREIQS